MLAEQTPEGQEPLTEEANPAPYATSILLAPGMRVVIVAVVFAPDGAVVERDVNARPVPQVTRIAYEVDAVSPVATKDHSRPAMTATSSPESSELAGNVVAIATRHGAVAVVVEPDR